MGEHDGDIRTLVITIWETLFAEPLEEVPVAKLRETPLVSSYVTIEGTWQGGLLVEMPMALALPMTARVLQTPGQPAVEEISDAMGEFCNIVAGNYKALVPAPSHLSLPVVTLGSDYEQSVVGASSATTVAFACDGHEFHVTVHEGGEAG